MKDKIIIIDQYNTTGNNNNNINKNYIHNKHKSLSKRTNLFNVMNSTSGYSNNSFHQHNNSFYQNNKKDYEPKLKVY